VERVMNEVSADLIQRTDKGVTTPRMVFAPAIADTRKVISGAPFEAGADAAIWADFKGKVEKLTVEGAVRKRLLADGEAALSGPFRRGFEKVITTLEATAKRAGTNDGVWRLPEGDVYYANRVKISTTTDLTPDQVHDIGLKELTRIQGEMEGIKAKVGFKGTLREFFAFVTSDPRFHYPNTEAGREQYLSDARALIAQALAKAPAFFHRLPKAPLEVRAVERWREVTTSVAFYNRGTPDGSRPGIFYVNLSDLTQTLKPQIEGISYHEGAPGHHFQIAIQQELEGVPTFQKFAYFGSYVEGWGLYSERLAKEEGRFTDPMQDFGRLQNEMLRAARLVVDTGAHAKQWTREQMIDYMLANNPMKEEEATKEVERYIDNPGPALSYKIGMIRILDLRERAKRELGPKFDIRDFHDVVLKNGAVSLTILEQLVDDYITDRKAKA
jgi:uncharacterized protein (DUF885 family)